MISGCLALWVGIWTDYELKISGGNGHVLKLDVVMVAQLYKCIKITELHFK